MPKDFKRFPELRNSELEVYIWQSPHKQILEGFVARVERVIDGDTIKVKWQERDFAFPVRLMGIQAPELSEGGRESKEWLEQTINGKEVYVEIDYDNRVEKWGRILGRIHSGGVDIAELSIMLGHSVEWENRNVGKIPPVHKVIKSVEEVLS